MPVRVDRERRHDHEIDVATLRPWRARRRLEKLATAIDEICTRVDAPKTSREAALRRVHEGIVDTLLLSASCLVEARHVDLERLGREERDAARRSVLGRAEHVVADAFAARGPRRSGHGLAQSAHARSNRTL